MLYNIRDLYFNRESHYEELVREFGFVLSMDCGLLVQV
jgi:hypothetical protein